MSSKKKDWPADVPVWLSVMRGITGLTETPGSADNPKIEPTPCADKGYRIGVPLFCAPPYEPIMPPELIARVRLSRLKPREFALNALATWVWE